MNDWLTLSQAATLAGCSRKTLYRYMNRNLLAYRREANNRRYVLQRDILSLFETRQTVTSTPAESDSSSRVEHRLDALMQVLNQQNVLLLRMIELYQPKTLQELAKKHR